MKKLSVQEAQVLSMIKKSNVLFPERKEFLKVDNVAIGQAH